MFQRSVDSRLKEPLLPNSPHPVSFFLLLVNTRRIRQLGGCLGFSDMKLLLSAFFFRCAKGVGYDSKSHDFNTPSVLASFMFGF
jgi:hypothetical protein